MAERAIDCELEDYWARNGLRFVDSRRYVYDIIERSGKVIEAHLCDIPEPFSNITEQEGFAMSDWNVEIQGL